MKIQQCTILCLSTAIAMLWQTGIQAQNETLGPQKNTAAKSMTIGHQPPAGSGEVFTGLAESNKYEQYAAAYPKVQVSRWISPVTGDFTSIPNNKSTDAQLPTFGYREKIFQYEAYGMKPPGEAAIAVYRWIMPNCREFILVGEHEYTDAQLLAKGYTGKELVFYAYKTDPGDGRHVKVSKWMNTATNGCKDYTLSVTELEYPGYSLSDFGYTNKTTQFYVPLPSASLKANFTTIPPDSRAAPGTQFYFEILNAPPNLPVEITITGLPYRNLRKFTMKTDAAGRAVLSQAVPYGYTRELWTDLTPSEQRQRGEVTVTIPGTNNAKLVGLVLDNIRAFYK